MAQALSETLPGVPDFGCSDCHCSSHLFFSNDLEDIRNKAWDALRLKGLKPFVLVA